MAAADTSSTEVDWSNLLDDLLGMIRSRVASHRGRIRFAAVCRSWRAAASRHLATPALPLLVLSLHVWGERKYGELYRQRKQLYCPEEGKVLRLSVPSKLRNARFCGTYDGGWIAAMNIWAAATLTIVNLFSGVEVALSGKQKSMAWQGYRGKQKLIRKIIFSEIPTSSGCVLAALTTDQGKVALCRVGCPDEEWTILGCGTEEFRDVVFHCGALYGLTRRSDKLFKFDIGVYKDGAPTTAHLFDIQWHGSPNSTKKFTTYIFGLHGKLAMAVMTPWTRNRKPFFKVFELAAKDAHHYEQKEVRTLGDFALFLGQTCSSRMVHVQTGGRGIVKKNHIYYSKYSYTMSNEQLELWETQLLIVSIGPPDSSPITNHHRGSDGHPSHRLALHAMEWLGEGDHEDGGYKEL
ncbi:putative F-box protein At3g25750 [Lolium perenne]|uniref:putative F-box protein At3g25750 n=1 Tax=Lolium perenne TaxID=4522 RepID=UPI0021F69CBC|nr:uncharacterized protein LOC127339079 [Lolium perenne]